MQVAYYALHYGRDYLAWSIRSVQDAVEEIHIFYTPRPSYGHGGHASVPETREQLMTEAFRFANKPVIWHDCPQFRGEGQHRDFAVKTLKERGAHQILVVDADEVWLEGEAAKAIDEATRANRARNWSATFIHFYRSVHYVCTDHFLPIRVIDLRHSAGNEQVKAGPVLHFGYAQRSEIIRYKWTCHGHQAELRPGWIDRFMAWNPESRDLHPVVIGLWPVAQRVDDAMTASVAKVLQGHPYLDVGIIE